MTRGRIMAVIVELHVLQLIIAGFMTIRPWLLIDLKTILFLVFFTIVATFCATMSFPLLVNDYWGEMTHNTAIALVAMILLTMATTVALVGVYFSGWSFWSVQLLGFFSLAADFAWLK